MVCFKSLLSYSRFSHVSGAILFHKSRLFSCKMSLERLIFYEAEVSFPFNISLSLKSLLDRIFLFHLQWCSSYFLAPQAPFKVEQENSIRKTFLVFESFLLQIKCIRKPAGGLINEVHSSLNYQCRLESFSLPFR